MTKQKEMIKECNFKSSLTKVKCILLNHSWVLESEISSGKGLYRCTRCKKLISDYDIDGDLQ